MGFLLSPSKDGTKDGPNHLEKGFLFLFRFYHKEMYQTILLQDTLHIKVDKRILFNQVYDNTKIKIISIFLGRVYYFFYYIKKS